MSNLKPLEAGVMFWAGDNPRQIVQGVKALGVQSGQLGIAGDYLLLGAAPLWREALEQEQFTLVTAFAAYTTAGLPAGGCTSGTGGGSGIGGIGGRGRRGLFGGGGGGGT